MNKDYAKTMLYAYPHLDMLIKRLDRKIMQKAKASMFDTSPCEEQCVKIILLNGKKKDLKYLKHLVELVMMKFPIQQFNYFDYKYFRISPKGYYKDKIKVDRTYFRMQERLLDKFCAILNTIGISDEWFEQKYLSIIELKRLCGKIKRLKKAYAKNDNVSEKCDKND